MQHTMGCAANALKLVHDELILAYLMSAMNDLHKKLGSEKLSTNGVVTFFKAV